MLEINNTTQQKINFRKTRQLVAEFLRIYQREDYDVSLAIIGSARMRTLNYKYRGQNKTTDVLSFSGLGKNPVPKQIKSIKPSNFLGEIIINISETKKFSKYKKMFQDIGIDFSKIKPKLKVEAYLFYFLLVHGLLHLIAYNDDTSKERDLMLNLGKDFLEETL